ncbi:MAG: aquaporin [Phycisphaerales bacterium]
MKSLVPGCVAEFLGTFALTFFGCAAIMLRAPEVGGHGSLITVALAHALILYVFVGGCMYISGAQFNPAVSIGAVIAGKQGVGRAAAFIVCQLAAAAAAVALLGVLLPREVFDHEPAQHGATIGHMTRAGLVWQVIGIEAIMTFCLMFVILTTTVDERAHKMGGLPIGLTVGACILAFGPLTGSSMNPARSFGPALVGDHWTMFHAYIIGPVAGAVVAALVWKALFAKPTT